MPFDCEHHVENKITPTAHICFSSSHLSQLLYFIQPGTKVKKGQATIWSNPNTYGNDSTWTIWSKTKDVNWGCNNIDRAAQFELMHSDFYSEYLCRQFNQHYNYDRKVHSMGQLAFIVAYNKQNRPLKNTSFASFHIYWTPSLDLLHKYRKCLLSNLDLVNLSYLNNKHTNTITFIHFLSPWNDILIFITVGNRIMYNNLA